MSRNYKCHNPEGMYFVSFAFVEWLDVFTRDEYKNILLDSLRYCQNEKGMEIFAWCIMPNHVHLIFRSINGQRPELLLGDFKRFTSKALVKAIQENPSENQKTSFLKVFENAGKASSNVNVYQFWQHHSHPIELWSAHVIVQKLNYIHYNPVIKGLAQTPEDYEYSSAADYSGKKGLLADITVWW